MMLLDPIEFGLSIDDAGWFAAIFATAPASIEEAAIFGSRATGAYRPTSDIDVVVTGPVSLRELSELRNACEESDLTVEVDFIRSGDISNPALNDHIQRVKKVFFRRDAS